MIRVVGRRNCNFNFSRRSTPAGLWENSKLIIKGLGVENMDTRGFVGSENSVRFSMGGERGGSVGVENSRQYGSLDVPSFTCFPPSVSTVPYGTYSHVKKFRSYCVGYRVTLYNATNFLRTGAKPRSSSIIEA